MPNTPYIKTREQKGIGGGGSRRAGSGNFLAGLSRLLGTNGTVNIDSAAPTVDPSTGEGISGHFNAAPSSKWADFLSGGDLSRRAAGLNDSYALQQALLPLQTNSQVSAQHLILADRLAQELGIAPQQSAQILQAKIAEKEALDPMDLRKKHMEREDESNQLLAAKIAERQAIDPLDIAKRTAESQATNFFQQLNPEQLNALTRANLNKINAGGQDALAQSAISQNKQIEAESLRDIVASLAGAAGVKQFSADRLASATNLDALPRITNRQNMIDEDAKLKLAHDALANTALASTPGALGLTVIPNEHSMILGDVFKTGKPAFAMTPGKAPNLERGPLGLTGSVGAPPTIAPLQPPVTAEELQAIAPATLATKNPAAGGPVPTTRPAQTYRPPPVPIQPPAQPAQGGNNILEILRRLIGNAGGTNTILNR